MPAPLRSKDQNPGRYHEQKRKLVAKADRSMEGPGHAYRREPRHGMALWRFSCAASGKPRSTGNPYPARRPARTTENTKKARKILKIIRRKETDAQKQRKKGGKGNGS